MRSEGGGNPVYETPVYDNNRNPRENLQQNVEIADKNNGHSKNGFHFDSTFQNQKR